MNNALLLPIEYRGLHFILSSHHKTKYFSEFFQEQVEAKTYSNTYFMWLAQDVIDYFLEYFRDGNLKKACSMPRTIMRCSYRLIARVAAFKILNEFSNTQNT